jgi:hypothetical protein
MTAGTKPHLRTSAVIDRRYNPLPLFGLLLLGLGQREALRLFAANFAFLGVISALTVSHIFLAFFLRR